MTITIRHATLDEIHCLYQQIPAFGNQQRC